MKKLNSIITTSNVTAYGFPAFKGLESYSNQNGNPVIISTLSAAVMADMGIDAYYAPVIPRGTIFNSTDDIIAADLDVNTVYVQSVDDITTDNQVIIASQHKGTVELLQNMYPNNTVLAFVAPDDIRDKDVVGTLPPHLIQYAGRFKAVTIKDFDYTKDKEISGMELQARLIVTGSIRVTIN